MLWVFKTNICSKKNYNLRINKKKVYRLCKLLDILRLQRKLKPKHPKKLARNTAVNRPNQLWETDIKYGWIEGENRFFYILSYIDVFDRCIKGLHIGLRCTAFDAAVTLKKAVQKECVNDKQLTIRSDNGPQFIADTFQKYCLNPGLHHERIPFKTPNKNAHIESYHSILEDECLSRYEFNTFAEAYDTVSNFIKFIMK